MTGVKSGDQFPFPSFDADRCYRRNAFDIEDVFQATNLMIFCGRPTWLMRSRLLELSYCVVT